MSKNWLQKFNFLLLHLEYDIIIKLVLLKMHIEKSSVLFSSLEFWI